jgi:two-component system response regulator YesN
MVLVEDESFERTSLMHCIDWGLIGVEIIGDAANGSQGLARVMELKPDIVLTDVKMPVLDGIEMSRRIRQIAPETKILFLSSYDDFEYAKQAIDLHIAAYVMKPVNEAELLRVVKRAADEVTQKALEQRLLTKNQTSLSISLNLARQAFVNRVLTGMSVEKEDARSLGLEWLFSGSENLGLTLSLYAPQQAGLSDADLDHLNRSLLRLCGQSINICIDAGRLVTLCAFPESAGEVDAERVKECLARFFESRPGGAARIESLLGAGGIDGAAELYARILKRISRPVPEAPEFSDRHRGKREIAAEVEEILNTQYDKPLSLESIARVMHFTPNYIGSVFKSVNKVSVNRYLMNVRIKRAEAMLRMGSLSVAEIAECCGFGSITYFHTIFKKEKGITPTEYRQAAGGAQRA